jgi:hypothetical protein
MATTSQTSNVTVSTSIPRSSKNTSQSKFGTAKSDKTFPTFAPSATISPSHSSLLPHPPAAKEHHDGYKPEVFYLPSTGINPCGGENQTSSLDFEIGDIVAYPNLWDAVFPRRIQPTELFANAAKY